MPESALLEVLDPSAKPGGGEGTTLVELDQDHPGFRDSAYRARRNRIAGEALAWREGDPAPTIAYTEEEQGVWRTVQELLGPRHRNAACAEYMECRRAVALPEDRIPQLEEVNAVVHPLTGFRMLPVAGLVSPRAFLDRLADGVFLATQYIRHPSAPLYTPEPDVIHELIGHAATFAHPGYAELSRHFGRAARVASDEDVERIGRVYWYTLEFGAALEDGVPKAYGAGLLSSVGEMDRLGDAELRRFDVNEIAATGYDPTDYQPSYFLAPGFPAMVESVRSYLGRFAA